MTIRAVIFDFDMTLIDSSYAILNSTNKLAARFGKPLCSREQVLSVIGYNSKDFWNALLGGFDDEYRRFYRDQCMPCEQKLMRPLDGAFECVKALQALGVKVGCASNRDNPVRVLRLTGLESLMGCIVGARDVEHPKPAGDVIIKAMNLLNAVPEETIYVGDTAIDVAAAKNAGLRCAALLSSNSEEVLKAAGAWRICKNLLEVAELVKTENGARARQ